MISLAALRANIVVVSFDIEVSSSDRQTGYVCPVGGYMDGERWTELGKSSDKQTRWSDHAISVHQITPEMVEDARDHVTVIKDFLTWAVAKGRKQAVAGGRNPDNVKLALNCHNGAACDLDWLFHYKRRYNLLIPPEFEYYFDTLTIVRLSLAHPFNKGNYDGPVALESLYALGNLYVAMFGCRYNDEHDAGADAEAGHKILMHKVRCTLSVRCSIIS